MSLLINSNSKQLALQIAKMLNQDCNINLKTIILPVIKLVDANGELIYNSGNRVRIRIYTWDQIAIELKTVDNFNHNMQIDYTTQKQPPHNLVVYLNPVNTFTNWHIYQLGSHQRGFIGHCKFTDNLESLIRYTNSSQGLNNKLLRRVVTAYFNKSIVEP